MLPTILRKASVRSPSSGLLFGDPKNVKPQKHKRNSYYIHMFMSINKKQTLCEINQSKSKTIETWNNMHNYQHPTATIEPLHNNGNTTAKYQPIYTIIYYSTTSKQTTSEIIKTKTYQSPNIIKREKHTKTNVFGRNNFKFILTAHTKYKLLKINSKKTLKQNIHRHLDKKTKSQEVLKQVAVIRLQCFHIWHGITLGVTLGLVAWLVLDWLRKSKNILLKGLLTRLCCLFFSTKSP